MKKILLSLLVGTLLVGCGGGEEEVVERDPIGGQIFIVTKSRENVKLGLVTVKVYDEAGIEKIRSAAKSILEQRLALIHKYVIYDGNASADAYPRWDRWLEVFQQDSFKKGWIDSAIAEATPSTEAKTDADGRFLFIPPSDKFMLAATTSRLTGDTQEDYRWLEVFQRDSIGPSGLLLSNDNLLEDLTESPVLPPDARDRFHERIRQLEEGEKETKTTADALGIGEPDLLESDTNSTDLLKGLDDL